MQWNPGLICNEDVGGGQFNWKHHINIKAHPKKLEKDNLPPLNCKQQITSFFAFKFTQQSATLNAPPPAHATSSSQKSSDTIIIDDDIDLKDTPSV